MWYRAAADAIVLAHFAYVAFIVGGLAAILLGAWRGWMWVRGIWFRLMHLAAIAVVGLEAVVGVTCPLTSWERHLRRLAGQDVDEASFVGRFAHDVLFVEVPESSLRIVHVAFAIVVAATLVMVPPKRRRPSVDPLLGKSGQRSA
jgi:hypothetical protein